MDTHEAMLKKREDKVSYKDSKVTCLLCIPHGLGEEAGSYDRHVLQRMGEGAALEGLVVPSNRPICNKYTSTITKTSKFRIYELEQRHIEA